MADNSTKIDSCVQNWLIAHPIILKISNPSNLKLSTVLSYKGAEIISRTVTQVFPDAEGIYKLALTEAEQNLVYKLTAAVPNPKIDIVLRAYDGITLTYTDSRTLNIILGNRCWVKENEVWKKAIPYIKLNNTTDWKKGTVWYKNPDNVWSQ